MKKHILLFLMLLPVVTNADPIEIDGIWYELHSSNTASVVSNPSKYTGDIVIPNTIEYLDVSYVVNMIGANAFWDCIGLTSITLPNSIAYIEGGAFGDCPNVIIPYSNIPELESIWIEREGLFVMSPFSTDCKIFVPASLLETYKKSYLWKMIGSQLFAIEGETEYNVTVHAQEHTSDICSVIGEEHLDHIISLKLSGTINGYDVQVIRERMPLLHHLDLSNVNIVVNGYPYYIDENGNSYHTENDVLGDYCFANMTELQDIQLPQNIKKIGNYAFSGCKTLRTLNFPKGINSIGDFAFTDCSIESIVVNNSEPASISSSTFPNCENMTLLIFEGNKTAYLSENYWKDFKEIIDSTDYIHFADEKVEKICIWDVLKIN